MCVYILRNFKIACAFTVRIGFLPFPFAFLGAVKCSHAALIRFAFLLLGNYSAFNSSIEVSDLLPSYHHTNDIVVPLDKINYFVPLPFCNNILG